jgi:hypothetical protein
VIIPRHQQLVAYAFAATVFLLLRPTFWGPDGGWYASYTQSLLDHGDLNLVRQADSFLYPEGELLVSRTYNLPDFHNHGGVIVWAPFALYARLSRFLFSFLLVPPDAGTWFHASLSLTTYLSALLTGLLSFVLCRSVFGGQSRSIAAVLLVFFGTPCFFYATLAPGNANLLASAFSALILLFAYRCREFDSRDWLLFGAFFSVCLAIKVDLWFLGIPLGLILGRLVAQKEAGRTHVLAFVGGIIPGLALKLINDYLRYGTLASGEIGIINLDGNILREQLFSPFRGYFFTSPIYYVALLGLLGVALRATPSRDESADLRVNREKAEWDRYFLASGSVYLLVKILAISFRYNWSGGSVGARILIADFPIVCLLVRRAMELARGRAGAVLLATSLGFTAWNWIVVSQFVTGDDLRFLVNPPGLWERLSVISSLLEEFKAEGVNGKALEIKLLLGIPLLLSVCVIGRWRRGRVIRRNWTRTLVSGVSCYCIGAYGLVTFLNVANNQRNVRAMTANDLYERARVVEASYFVDRWENLPSLQEVKQYYQAIHDTDGFARSLGLERLIRERMSRTTGAERGTPASEF